MGPRTWPWSATSPSTWYANAPTNAPSSAAASAQLGTLNTCSTYWGRCGVNLDSLPCNLRAAALASAPVLAPALPPLAGGKRRKFMGLSKEGNDNEGAGKGI